MNPNAPRIAINIGSGHLPGLDQVVAGAVLAASELGWEIVGIRDGYDGVLYPERYPDGGLIHLRPGMIDAAAHRGNMIGTAARTDPFRVRTISAENQIEEVDRSDDLLQALRKAGVEAVISLVGGSAITGMHALVYGPPAYAYPPVTYPPPGAVAAGMAISFGVGVAMGAFWGGGGWGYNCGWHGGNNNITINNNNNNFVRNSNVQGGNRVSKGGTWQHNPQHRGGAPYSDRSTANKYGGAARGDSMQQRQANANQGVRAGPQPAGGRDMSNRGSGQTAGNRDVSNRGSEAGNRDAGRPSAGSMEANRGGDRAGNQRVPGNTPSATNRSAFGGAGSGTSGSQARASSSRGSSSVGGSRGGGGRRR